MAEACNPISRTRLAPELVSMLSLEGTQTSRKQFAAESADAGGFVKSPKDDNDYF